MLTQKSRQKVWSFEKRGYNPAAISSRPSVTFPQSPLPPPFAEGEARTHN